WNHLSQSQSYKSWSGYAFESVCIKHLRQIKRALGISGIRSNSYSFFKKGNQEEKGAQIDLVLDRADQVINVFEIKFSNRVFSIDKAYFENLSNKIEVFQRSTKTRKQIFLVFINPFGLVENNYSSIVSSTLGLEDIF
ncbi:MAG: ATP-binding protein, partial [Bacteroidota bacterium]